MTEELTAEKLTEVFRTGFTDTIAIPEVCGEIAFLTHKLLGCTFYGGMLTLFAAAECPGLAVGPSQYLNQLGMAELRRLAGLIVVNGGPIGVCECV